MTNFRIFDGNAEQFDTRQPDVFINPEWAIGTSLMLANLDEDVKIFTPKFNFRAMLSA